MKNDYLECDKCCTKIFDYDEYGDSKYEIIKLSWSYGMNDKKKRHKDSSSEILIIA